MGLGGCSAGGDRDLADKGVHEEASRINCRVRHREANLRAFYREGGKIQQFPKVVVGWKDPAVS